MSKRKKAPSVSLKEKYAKKIVEDNPAEVMLQSKRDDAPASSDVHKSCRVRRSTRKSSSRYATGRRSDQTDVTDSLGIHQTSKSSSNPKLVTRGAVIAKDKRNQNIKTRNKKERQLSAQNPGKKFDILRTVSSILKKSKASALYLESKPEGSVNNSAKQKSKASRLYFESKHEGSLNNSAEQCTGISLLSDREKRELSSTDCELDESDILSSTEISDQTLQSLEAVTKQIKHKVVKSRVISLLSDSSLRKRKPTSRSQAITILSADASKLCSSSSAIPSTSSEMCVKPSEESILSITQLMEPESGICKDFFPLMSNVTSSPSRSNETSIDIPLSKTFKISPCQSNQELELSNLSPSSTGSEKSLPVSMETETLVESTDGIPVFRKTLKEGISRGVMSKLRFVNRSEFVCVDKEVQTVGDVGVEEGVKTMQMGVGQDKDDVETLMSGSLHSVEEDMVFSHVSALVNDEFVKSAQVNAFIQGMLPRLTGIKCITSQDHMTINGSIVAVNKAWHLLNKMVKTLPDDDVITCEVDTQADHDYNQPTKSLKIMWTEPNGCCYELPCESISDGKYVAKKPTKTVVPTQAKSTQQSPSSASSRNKDYQLKASNSVMNEQLPGTKGDNCNTHYKQDRQLRCSDTTDQEKSNSSITDQSDSKLCITNQLGEVLLDHGKDVADGAVYVKCFESLPEVTGEERHGDSDHQFISNLANQEVIDIAESKQTVERDRLVSNLNDLENNVEVGKEKLVMITGPFGDKQCIVLTVDNPFEENVNTDLESDPSERDMDDLYCSTCKERFDSYADMTHHKTCHFNLAQEPAKITVNTMNENTADFDSNVEISQSSCSDGNVDDMKSLGETEISQVTESVLSEVKCNKCSATFTHLEHLKQHMHDHHLANRHNCGVCGKAFSEKRYLHAHLNRHFGIKKHVCLICGWKFFERHKLKLHMETHKAADKRRLPYRCVICLHQFHNRATWSDHMNTHTGAKPFTCSTCPAKFAHRIGLKRHWLVHARETPFKCVYCEKGFKLKTKLQDHLTVHTGRGRHSCQVCQKVFTASASLKRHVYTAHWENSSPSAGKQTLFMCWKCGAMFHSLKETEEHTSKPCVSQIKLEVEDSSASELASVTTDTAIVIQSEHDDTNTDAQLQSLLSSLQNREGGNSGLCSEKSMLDEVEQMKLAASTLADLYSYTQEIKKEKE